MSMTPFSRAGLLAAGLTLAAPSLVRAADTPAAGPFKSQSVELPSGDRPFPPGPNVEIVSGNCVTCHSAGMILNQPNLTKATWEAEVNKMRNVYKAPVDKADVPAIVAYLAAVKGT